MNNYELLYILPSTMTGAEIKKTFVEIEKEIENFGGKKLQTLLDHPFLLKTEVSKEEAVELQDLPIIKKRLAYPIEKNRFGFYCLFNFSSEGKILQELNKYLLRNKNVLRHIIVQEDPMNIEQLKQLQKLFARKKAEGDKEEIAKKKEEIKKEKVLTEIKKVQAPKEEAKEIKAGEDIKEIKAPLEVKEVQAPKEEAKEIKSGEDKKEVPAPKEDIKEIKAPLEVKEVQAPKEEEPKEEKKTTKTRKKKIKLEDLEEKLDEILEDTML